MLPHSSNTVGPVPLANTGADPHYRLNTHCVLDLYSTGLTVRLGHRGCLLAQTNGISPPRIHELLGKDALRVVFIHDPLVVTAQHIDAALHELWLTVAR